MLRYPKQRKKEITFDEQDIQDPHHDELVITLYIATQFVGSIVVDEGSLVNIIILYALNRMNIPKSKLFKRSSLLIGFNNEPRNAIGEIKIPVYIEGVNSMQRFCVISALSSYNLILGRPWIHDLKVVPSMYHQCVKMPTPWGTMKIISDQQESKECYKTSMKPSPVPRQT